MTELWALQTSPRDQRYNSDHIPTVPSSKRVVQRLCRILGGGEVALHAPMHVEERQFRNV
jgi:hypothetical protein